MYCQFLKHTHGIKSVKTCAEKAATALAFLFVSVSFNFFSGFLLNNKQFINPFAIITN